LDYRADLRNLKTTKKFKMPQLTEEGADQAAAAGRKKKKKKHYSTTWQDYNRALA
jgi:hypothetical protein